MTARLASVAACVVIVMLWSTTEAGAQTCPDESATPQATSEQVEFTGIAPGQRRSWTTTVTNAHDHPVAVRASLEGTGALSSVLRIGLRTCTTPWQPTGPGTFSCAGGASVVLAPTTLGAGLDVDLPVVTPSDSLYALFGAELPSSTGNELQGAVGSVRSLMVWQQQCGPATTTTTTPSSPTTLNPTSPPTTAPTTPTAVPVTVPPSSTPTTEAEPVSPRRRSPRPGRRADDDPSRPGALPFTGGTTTLTLLVAAGLLVAGAAVLVASRRGERDDDQEES